MQTTNFSWRGARGVNTGLGGFRAAPLLRAAALGGFFLLLAACAPVGEMPRQHLLEWGEARLLYVADSRSGSIRAFSLATTAPVAVAQAHVPASAGIRALALDGVRGRLWVLAADRVEALDARRLTPLGPALRVAAAVSALRVDGDGVVLLAADGAEHGRIDAALPARAAMVAAGD